VYIRTFVSSEFKISYSKLGPTEIRLVAILFNTVMFFFGMHLWAVELRNLGTIPLNPYDLAIGLVTLILFFFFLTTAVQEGRRLRATGDQ
jgi:hypothetical protein